MQFAIHLFGREFLSVAYAAGLYCEDPEPEGRVSCLGCQSEICEQPADDEPVPYEESFGFRM